MSRITGASPGKSPTTLASSRIVPASRLARVDLQPHLAPLGRRLELVHLERDQLRLALLVVDAALHDEHAVGLEQVARGRVDGVEDDDLGAADDVVEPQEDHRVALLRRQLLEPRDDAADGDDLAVAPALEVGQRRVASCASWSRIADSGCSET